MSFDTSILDDAHDHYRQSPCQLAWNILLDLPFFSSFGSHKAHPPCEHASPAPAPHRVCVPPSRLLANTANACAHSTFFLRWFRVHAHPRSFLPPSLTCSSTTHASPKKGQDNASREKWTHAPHLSHPRRRTHRDSFFQCPSLEPRGAPASPSSLLSPPSLFPLSFPASHPKMRWVCVEPASRKTPHHIGCILCVRPPQPGS